MNELILQKLKNVLMDNKGASNVEIVVWISVVLVIATLLFSFRNTIGNWISKATNTVNNFKLNN